MLFRILSKPIFVETSQILILSIHISIIVPLPFLKIVSFFSKVPHLNEELLFLFVLHKLIVAKQNLWLIIHCFCLIVRSFWSILNCFLNNPHIFYLFKYFFYLSNHISYLSHRIFWLILRFSFLTPQFSFL